MGIAARRNSDAELHEVQNRFRFDTGVQIDTIGGRALTQVLFDEVVRRKTALRVRTNGRIPWAIVKVTPV